MAVMFADGRGSLVSARSIYAEGGATIGSHQGVEADVVTGHSG
jgi:hypothetical protein